MYKLSPFHLTGWNRDSCCNAETNAGTEEWPLKEREKYTEDGTVKEVQVKDTITSSYA